MEKQSSRPNPAQGKKDIAPQGAGNLINNLPELLDLAKNFLYLGHKKEETENSRIEAVKKAIDANDAADKRQFEFQMTRIEYDREIKLDARKSSTRKFYAGLAIVTALLGFLLIMLFYGDEVQGSRAIEFFRYLLTGVAGYGIITGLIRLIRGIGKN